MHRAHANYFPGRARNSRHNAAPQKFSHGLARTKKLPGEIDTYHGVPLPERHLVKGRVALQAGVIDEDVDGPKSRQQLGEHRCDLFFAADIGLKRDCFPTSLSNLLRHPFRILWAGYIINRDCRAGRSERERTRLADSRVRTGNKRLLIFQRLNGVKGGVSFHNELVAGIFFISKRSKRFRMRATRSKGMELAPWKRGYGSAINNGRSARSARRLEMTR